MRTPRESGVVPAAAITARDLIGGLVVAVALGSLADTLPLPLALRRGIDGAIALSITIVAGGTWGRDIASAFGRDDPRRTSRLTAWSVGPAILATGALLAIVEPSVVARATRSGFQIHAVYTVLFILATAFASSVGAFALGVGLGDRRLGARLAWRASTAAVIAFLAIDLFMYMIGWRVGAPNAARRATMLVVTVLSATAAAVAAGATIGAVLSRDASAT